MKERKPNEYIRPIINRQNTSKTFVDLDSFLKVVFPNELHRQIASSILEYIKTHKQAYLITEIIPYIQKEVQLSHTKIPNPLGAYASGKNTKTKIVSKDTIARVYKKMWLSGLTSRTLRYCPVILSKIFVCRLRELADYWEAFVQQYK